MSADRTLPSIRQAYRRAVTGRRAPVRMVHLGLGAFHRSHQAWYTAHARDADDWGIAAFTGRSPGLADRLAAQEGLYTLVVRGAEGDRAEIVPSIVEAHAGSDVDALRAAMSLESVAVVTLTITEAGYDDAGPQSVLRRLLAAFDARRAAGGGPIAVVSCDNLPENGEVTRRAIETLAAEASTDLAGWIERHVGFVSTSVDRITPRVDQAEFPAIAETSGWTDLAPVVAEPFSDWVLQGEFPAGRPAWETAGARFVADVRPWERRKLWLLNGAHTILAGIGTLRGHTTVAQAIGDVACLRVVDAFWDEACRHLPDLDLAAYRAALIQRFENARIGYLLAQIADDASTKVRLRVVPVALQERAAGRPATGAARALAGWILGQGEGLDVRAELARIAPELAADQSFAAAVEAASRSIFDVGAPIERDRHDH